MRQPAGRCPGRRSPARTRFPPPPAGTGATTKLLQQLKKHRGRAAFRVEERRTRLVAELQQARLTGFRFKVPAETMSAKLADLPDGVSVERGRIEVRFDGGGGRPGAPLMRWPRRSGPTWGGSRRSSVVEVGRGSGDRPAAGESSTRAPRPRRGFWSSSREGSRTPELGRRTGGRWGNSSGGARREASGCATSCRSTSLVSQVLPVNPAAAATRTPWPGSGTGRCSLLCSTASRG